jgi:hypothetical protein
VREKAPGALDAVRRGEITVNTAYEQVMRATTNLLRVGDGVPAKERNRPGEPGSFKCIVGFEL